MESYTTRRFRELLAALPPRIQRQATVAYMHFQTDPWHPPLRFKRIRGSRDLYSVRIGAGYRALGQRDQHGVTWVWIGSHADYEDALGRL